MENIKVSDSNPSAEEYCKLRVDCGLTEMTISNASDALPRSLYSVTLRDTERLIGMGRIVGDGLHVQVVDIAVHPEYQKKGLSRIVMEKLVTFITENVDKNSVVSLFADVDWLYEKFGFRKPINSQGMFFRRDTVTKNES